MEFKWKNVHGITLIKYYNYNNSIINTSRSINRNVNRTNGILTQAQNAKDKTEYKNAEEKVRLAVMGGIMPMMGH